MNFDREKLEQKILFMQTNVIKLKKLSEIDGENQKIIKHIFKY